jgi:hypothetical protein
LGRLPHRLPPVLSTGSDANSMLDLWRRPVIGTADREVYLRRASMVKWGRI